MIYQQKCTYKKSTFVKKVWYINKSVLTKNQDQISSLLYEHCLKSMLHNKLVCICLEITLMQSLFGKHLNVITVWDVYTCTYAYQQISKSILTLLTHICTHTHTLTHWQSTCTHTCMDNIYNKQTNYTHCEWLHNMHWH